MVIIGLLICTIAASSVQGIDWLENYKVDARRSALVWTTSANISHIICPSSEPNATVLNSDKRSPREDMYSSIPLDLFPESALTGDQYRELRRREERVKTLFEGVIGDTRVINQDKARLIGELCGEIVSKCLKEQGATSVNAPQLTPSFIDGLVLPLGGAVARLFLERPPPSDDMAERHLDIDLGANSNLRLNSMHNVMSARSITAEVHWEAFARYGIKVLGNTMSREEYLDAIGLSTGVTMSLIHRINGTVLRQDVVTTARKYVGNFLKAYLLMSNQYYSYMDHSIAWLADDIAAYTADDILRLRNANSTGSIGQEWIKYAAEANKGLKNMRLISVGLLLSYRNGASVRFQSADDLIRIVPPSWMALKYMFPTV